MTKFLDTMGKIRRLEKRLQEQLASTQWFCENGSIYEVYLHSLNLEETAERLVFLTRVLPAYTGVPNAKLEVERRIKDCIPVEIGFTAEDWFCLRIPALLPKKAGGSADYVRSLDVYKRQVTYWQPIQPPCSSKIRAKTIWYQSYGAVLGICFPSHQKKSKKRLSFLFPIIHISR